MLRLETPLEERELFGPHRLSLAGAREDSAPVEPRRDGAFMLESPIEVRDGLIALLDRTRHVVQALDALQFVGMPQLRPIQRFSQYFERFIIGFQRNGKGMAVLAAQREGETRGVREAAG